MKILKISFLHQKDFNNFLKDEEIELSVIAETSDLGNVNITSYYYDVNKTLNLFSLDPNNFYILPPDPEEPNNEIIKILAKQEGSGIIKASFRYLGENFYYSHQFVCHDSFFKNNYLTYLFPTIDAQNISKNPFVKSIFDTLMEMIDILYAYNEDLRIIPSFTEGKSKFISLLSQNAGFERIDFTEFNTKYEYVNDETFREVIANMFDLLSIRGTKLAYELFFNALGYNTTIQEFWYDSDGNLIEINPDDESLSTYYAYQIDGTLISPAIPRLDPRKDNIFLSNDYNSIDSNYIRLIDQNTGEIYYQPKGDVKITQKINSYEHEVFKSNKSNYIRVIFDSSINDNFFEKPENFSVEKKIIIKRYLDFLRPSHIQYILETFGIDLNGSSNVDEINVLQNEDPIYDFLAGTLKEFNNLQGSQDLLLDVNIVDLILDQDINNVGFNIGIEIPQNEEFSFNNRWDFILKFDQEELYDYKDMLNEELYANEIRII